MKNNKLIKVGSIIAVLLSGVGVNFSCAEEGNLLPLPGSEYERGPTTTGKLKRRDYTFVDVADLVDGSPQFVFCKLLQACKKLDFIEAAKWTSPANFIHYEKYARDNKGYEDLNMYKQIKVGDSRIDGDRCYFYIGFPYDAYPNPFRMHYYYFLKREGRWISVMSTEWQNGEFKTVR